jgi:hypothetical protein
MGSQREAVPTALVEGIEALLEPVVRSASSKLAANSSVESLSISRRMSLALSRSISEKGPVPRWSWIRVISKMLNSMSRRLVL